MSGPGADRTLVEVTCHCLRPCAAEPDCLEVHLVTRGGEGWAWCLPTGGDPGRTTTPGLVGILALGSKPALFELDDERRPVRELTLDQARTAWSGGATVLLDQRLLGLR